jgi:hypothetical protein
LPPALLECGQRLSQRGRDRRPAVRALARRVDERPERVLLLQHLADERGLQQELVRDLAFVVEHRPHPRRILAVAHLARHPRAAPEQAAPRAAQ